MSDLTLLGAPIVPARAELLDHRHGRLIGATLRWKRYRGWTVTGPSGLCELCGERFTDGGTPGLNSGYSVLGGGPAGQDDYRWICAVCYEIGRDRFCWTVLDTRGESTEPPDLLGTAQEWSAWQAPADCEWTGPGPTEVGDTAGSWAAPLPGPLPRTR